MSAAVSRGSWSIGSVAGIPVRLHWSVAVIAVLLATSLASSVGAVPAVLGVIAFLSSILAHELSHALVARRSGVATRSIELWALGGMARLDRQAPTAGAEASIAVAGPIASAVVGVTMLGAWWSMPGDGWLGGVRPVAGWLAVVNIGLAIFNMLPGAPLDGGRVLKAWRWSRHGDRHRATREAGTAGMVLGWVLAAVGLFLTLEGFGTIMLVLVGAFIAMNARVEIAAADMQSRVAGVLVDDLAWIGVATAHGDLDVESMLWDRRRMGGAGAIVVTDTAGRAVGLVTEEAMSGIDPADRPWTTLESVMVPLADVVVAEWGDEVVDLLARIDPSNPVIAVGSPEGITAVVPPRRIRQVLEI
jgi:Zn-dependent protease